MTRIVRGFAFLLLLSFEGLVACAEDPSASPFLPDIDAPPHNYHARSLHDPFSLVMDRLQSDPRLDRSGEKPFLVSLLKILGIPVSSQMLVFSTTSLQLRFISTANPRAIYFSESVYVGYIPGGRIEVVGLDPELGAIFYIFDIPRDNQPIRFERSERCMNCHVSDDTGHVPGLVIKSVVPAPGGGSLDAFRGGQSGHGIPFSERFGGWHVTGFLGTQHWGNVTGRSVGGVIQTIPNPPGERFSFSKYPVATSDILAHLLHEHQVGFVNRVVEAGYRARATLFVSDGKLTPSQASELDEQAHRLTRYLLFADEAAIPAGGVVPDPEFKSVFLEQRRKTSSGLSLKDLELTSRLFQHRCSYMIYSPIFQALPPVLKSRVYRRMQEALGDRGGDKEFAYLTPAEKRSIRGILKATLPDLQASW